MKSLLPDAAETRKPDHPIEKLLYQRWSPRAMSGERLTDEEIFTLFEAGRWAPSTFNEQEWRFLYAKRESGYWDLFFGLLAEANQEWCADAGLLVVVLARKFFTRNGKPNPVHLFDCGAAFQNICLQGTAMGLVVHGMAGFDYDKARAELMVTSDFDVAAMFAAGRPGDPAKLPEDLREREFPSDRRAVRGSIFEGPFVE